MHNVVSDFQAFAGKRRRDGYVDAHLVAAARLTAGASLWTRDSGLDSAARDLRVAAAL